MDDARRHFEMCDIRQPVLRGNKSVQQFVARQQARVKVDLQGANAGRQIEDTLQPADIDSALQIFHQRVGAKTQIEIEFERSVLDEQILVARLPVHDLHLSGSSRNGMKDRLRHCTWGTWGARPFCRLAYLWDDCGYA